MEIQGCKEVARCEGIIDAIIESVPHVMVLQTIEGTNLAFTRSWRRTSYKRRLLERFLSSEAKQMKRVEAISLISEFLVLGFLRDIFKHEVSKLQFVLAPEALDTSSVAQKAADICILSHPENGYSCPLLFLDVSCDSDSAKYKFPGVNYPLSVAISIVRIGDFKSSIAPNMGIYQFVNSFFVESVEKGIIDPFDPSTYNRIDGLREFKEFLKESLEKGMEDCISRMNSLRASRTTHLLFNKYSRQRVEIVLAKLLLCSKHLGFCDFNIHPGDLISDGLNLSGLASEYIECAFARVSGGMDGRTKKPRPYSRESGGILVAEELVYFDI